MLSLEQQKFIADYFYKKVGKAIPCTEIQEGRFNRFRDNSKRNGGKPLFLFVYPSLKGQLHFIGGDWRDKEGPNFSYHGEEEAELTSEEKRELQRMMKESIEQEHRERLEATERAEKYVKTLPPLDDVNLPSPHPYLVRKGLKRSYIGKYDEEDNTIVIPLQDAKGEFKSYQKIYSTGKKGFATGASTQGAFRMLWGKEIEYPILVCEGLATGISILEATEKKYIVVLAMTCHNLTEAIKRATDYLILSWKSKERPEEFYKHFLIIADNDPGGQGEEWAKKASKETGCAYSVVPNFGDNRISDANDIAVFIGQEKLKEILRRMIDEFTRKNCL